VTVSTGEIFTVISVAAVAVQPAPVEPVTVYVVVTAGLQITVGPAAVLSPVYGDQLYVVAPEAVTDVDDSLHIDAETGVTETVKGGVTAIDCVAVP